MAGKACVFVLRKVAAKSVLEANPGRRQVGVNRLGLDFLRTANTRICYDGRCHDSM